MSQDELTRLVTGLLEKDEGCRLKPYRDTRGFLTVGIGRNLDGKGLTREEAIYLLGNDIKECIDSLSKLDFYNESNDVRKCVLINMCFNLGISGFMQFRKMIEAIKAGHFEGAAKEIRDSMASKQAGSRYERLAHYMERGQW